MRHAIPALLGLFLLSACGAFPPRSSSATALLRDSIRFHDPDQKWTKEPVSFTWKTSRPNGQVSYAFDIHMDADGTFSFVGERKGAKLEYRVKGKELWVRVDGEEDFSDDVRQEMGLTRDGGFFWRDYLGFLAGLPMCLAVPGIAIQQESGMTELEGKPVRAFRASFSPEVGSDLWTLYFDPETSQLLGCRFDRAELGQDGETILFEGLSEISGMKIPRTRRWYMNTDARFLGTDELTPTANP